MKIDKKEQLLLRSIENYLDDYRKTQLDGTVIISEIIYLDKNVDAFSFMNLDFFEENDDLPRA